jgi:hypothetical protein
MEEIVLVALGAVGALQAANEQNGDSNRDEHSENTSIHRKPMSEGLHLRLPFQRRSGPF